MPLPLVALWTASRPTIVPRRVMKDSPIRVDALAGAAAGLAAGLVVALLEGPQGMVAPALIGLTPGTIALGPYVLFAALVGAVFGAVFRYRRRAYAATVAGNVMTGLLWWVVRFLTLAPLVSGSRPRWTLAEASAAFPYLIGDLLYCGLMGLGLSLLVAVTRRLQPGSPGRDDEQRPVRVVILGGGFGGVGAAQRLERVPGVEVTVVSRSNSLLFTPMLAEVASGALEAQHISAPLRAACPVARFHHASAESADFEARTVPVRGGGCADGAAAGRDLQEAWSAHAARSGFVTLPGYLLFGACLAVFDRWLSALARLLFSDAVGDDEEGGAGARVLRALGWGAVGGRRGRGTLHVGHGRDRLPGHLGATGGLALTRHRPRGPFRYLRADRRQLWPPLPAPERRSGLGPGLGRCLWVLLVGAGRDHVAAHLARRFAFPSLVRHLAYGAGLGVTFHLLESRFSRGGSAETRRRPPR